MNSDDDDMNNSLFYHEDNPRDSSDYHQDYDRRDSDFGGHQKDHHDRFSEEASGGNMYQDEDDRRLPRESTDTFDDMMDQQR